MSTNSNRYSWPALAIEGVEFSALLDHTKSRRKKLSEHTSDVDLSPGSHYLRLGQVAIVSWRRDGDVLKGEPSRNLAYAILHAKQSKIKYLLIDIVSVDQGRAEKHDFSLHIAEFGQLYKRIPVIVSYGPASTNLKTTMLRPWIYFESSQYRLNTTSITCVNYDDPSYTSKKDYIAQWFIHQLRDIREQNLLTTISMILCGTMGMAKISDFQWFIPSCTPVISAAYQTMDENDYLLTLILFLHPMGIYEIFSDIRGMSFKRYSFKEVEKRGRAENYMIYLDTTFIALWYRWLPKFRLTIQPDTDVIILRKLGFSEKDRYEFLGHGAKYPERISGDNTCPKVPPSWQWL